jgi:general secretion pathway protein A
MYEPFYGLAEKPFNLTPDPKYLYPSHRHTEAVAHLEFGRRERGGFILITGEVGTGKTTLARYFLSRLDAQTATAFILYPAVTGAELLRSILDDLHIPRTGESLKDHVDSLHAFLLEARAQNREVVLLIDEAQDLAPDVLEQIRLISNLETDTEKLIQIVLMGQSELKDLLARHELRQLAQRITARYHLSALGRSEVEDYVRHRLKVAGGDGKVAFTPAALDAVHRLSQGVPRLINLLCDRALLAGYVSGARTIDADHVRRAGAEVLPPRPSRVPRGLAAGVAAVALVALAGLGVWRALPARAGAPAPVPPTTMAAAPVPAPAAAAAAVPTLGPAILGLPRDPSLGSAIAAVEHQWGAGPVLERTSLRTHLDQIRRLDLPVVLEVFHPARADTCFVGLLRLEGDEAVVSAGGSPLRVPVSELDQFWTRQAIFVWRDYDVVAAGGPERTSAWARDTLARLGYLDGQPDLAGAVTRFQRDAELTPDGVVGARTLMSLYIRGTYPRPRLGGRS